MKCVLAAINAKYIHSNLAVYNLKACAAGIGGVDVEICEYTINHRAAEILDDLYMKKADLLCFSCYIWNIGYVKTLVRDLKRLSPGLRIWLGGPEVSFHCEELLNGLPEADGILYGEGEESFPGLLRHYTEEAPWPDGCVYREGGRLRRTPAAAPADMGKIPFVYKDLEDFEHRILYYETSRGCPFSCSYCLSSIEKRLRFRPMGLVKQELSFFLDHKVPQVKLVDRTFNCAADRSMEIWSYIRDHDNGITNFHFEITAEILTEEETALLKTMRPGLIQLEIGVQSANPETIRAIHRKMDLEKVRTVTAAIGLGRNVHRHLDLIAGLPGEDYESFGHSFDQVYGMGPDQLQLGFLKVLKGSPMETEAPGFGICAQWEPPYEVLYTNWISHEELIRLKQVEEMVEIWYNSRQFLHTMEALVRLYGRPFLLYEALGRAYKDRGMAGRRHVREALYEFLLEFGAERFPEQKERLRQLLTLDYYLRENAKKRPAFALPEDRERLRRCFERNFPGQSLKKLLGRYHIERFVPPFVKEEEYWLFEYSARDALTGNGTVRKLNGERS